MVLLTLAALYCKCCHFFVYKLGRDLSDFRGISPSKRFSLRLEHAMPLWSFLTRNNFSGILAILSNRINSRQIKDTEVFGGLFDLYGSYRLSGYRRASSASLIILVIFVWV